MDWGGVQRVGKGKWGGGAAGLDPGIRVQQGKKLLKGNLNFDIPKDPGVFIIHCVCFQILSISSISPISFFPYFSSRNGYVIFFSSCQPAGCSCIIHHLCFGVFIVLFQFKELDHRLEKKLDLSFFFFFLLLLYIVPKAFLVNTSPEGVFC